MSNFHMKLGPGYFRLISHFERGPANDPKCRLTASGAALDAYLCPADVWTIGAGSIKRLDGSDVEMGDSITESEVFLLAERDAEDAADAVRKIQRPLTQNQFEAYTAFTHNLGEGNFRKIAPLIEEGRWEDVAEKMGEYVRAWGKYEGRWYYMALLGLKIRRTAEGLHSLGLPWQDVCDPDNIGMPKRREWQPEGTARDGTKGRYFDVLLPGATEFTAIEAMASALRPPELGLTTKADPVAVPAAGKAGQPVSDAQPQTPAAPAPKPAATSGPAAGPVAAPSAPQVPQKPLPVPASTKPPEPVTIPPSVQVSTQSDMGPTTRTMWVSKRFWGGVLIIAGRLIIVADIGGHFAPAVKSFIGDGILMDWMTGVIVTMIGELVLDRGEKKATGPIDTPKRIALTTPTP